MSLIISGIFSASMKIEGMIDGKRELVKNIYRQDSSEFTSFISNDENT